MANKDNKRTGKYPSVLHVDDVSRARMNKAIYSRVYYNAIKNPASKMEIPEPGSQSLTADLWKEHSFHNRYVNACVTKPTIDHICATVHLCHLWTIKTSAFFFFFFYLVDTQTIPIWATEIYTKKILTWA